MSLRVVLLCLVLVGRIVAMDFVLPLAGGNWTTSGPNSITWTYGKSDPKFVNLQLLHNNNEIFEPIPHLLAADGTFATGLDITSRMMLFAPSCIPGRPSLPTGSGYSLRMYSGHTDGNRTNLGTTNGTFNIVAGNPIECLQNGTLTTSAISVPTSIPTTFASSSSSLSRSRAGAIAGGVVGGLVACLLVAAFTVMYNKHRRNMRKRMTQQFMMKKGLVLAKPVDSKDLETI